MEGVATPRANLKALSAITLQRIQSFRLELWIPLGHGVSLTLASSFRPLDRLGLWG